MLQVVLILADISGDDGRMAHGLGMNEQEWLELRKKIDDSFWVMRVIGASVHLCQDPVPNLASPGYPPLKSEADGISCGAHK